MQHFAKFKKIQLDNLVDFEKCCKTRILNYFLAKIGADTAENDQHCAEILPIGRRVAHPGLGSPAAFGMAASGGPHAPPPLLAARLHAAEAEVLRLRVRLSKVQEERDVWRLASQETNS